jgi:hypothetical protein
MHRAFRRFAGAAGALIVLAAFSSGARGDSPSDAPGQGMLCMWALISGAAEAGDRCFPGKDPAFQAQLHQLVGRMDAYAAKNGPATPDQIASFHQEQGLGGTPTAALCQGDAAKFYTHLRDGVGPAKVRAMVEAMISRPGKPTWSTCL